MSNPSTSPGRDDGLNGKVAVVTGAASGIGQATAVAFARAGADSVVGYFPDDPHDVNETVAAVESAGGRCHPVAVDVRDHDQTDALARAALDAYGRLDIVVAAAGIVRTAPVGELDEQTWNSVLAVDLFGVVNTLRAGAKYLTGAGAMVAVSSISGGIYGWENHAHYAAAKAGVLGLCRSLAVELSPRRIRVNAVLPGLIKTPQTMDSANSLGEAGLERATRVIPLDRIGDADDVARTIRFLASSDSAYITGQQIVVDGGLSVRRPQS